MAIPSELDGDGFVLVSHADAGTLPVEGAQAEAQSGDDETAPPHYLPYISSFLDNISDMLWPLNKFIHDNPELGYKEFKAHDALTSFMESRREPPWKVTRSAYGMRTAWVAVYDSGKKGPVVSFNVEMDALPGIGHACGHNLIATASLAGGLATAAIMHHFSLPGKVVVFGTPAEEGGGGKIRLLERGAYREHGVDVSLISHPGTRGAAALMRTTAYTRFRVGYHGRAAHAAASPWEGVNALDGLITAYNALSVLRQQTMPGDIIQGHITSGGAAPNIIHEFAEGVFVVRALTRARAAALRKKVDACFRAGAEASGARLEVAEEGSYADHVPNRVLGRLYGRYWNALSPDKIPADPEADLSHGQTMASTDQGDISYAMPSLSVSFGVTPGPDGAGPHSPTFERAVGTWEAFTTALVVAKGLAGTALDVLTTEGLLDEVKAQWKKDMEEYK